MPKYKKLGADRFIRLSDAWLIFGGGRRPLDPDNPTKAEKRNGAAFYRRLCDKGVLAYKVVNGERFVRESDVARLWDSGSSPDTSTTPQRTAEIMSTAELRKRFEARLQRQRAHNAKEKDEDSDR